MKRVVFPFLAIAILIIMAGCNKEPVINSFAPALLKPNVFTEETVTFSVNASDPDENTTLTYSWAFTAGSPSKATTSSVLWTAPASACSAKAVLTVSDGKKTVTKTWEIAVNEHTPSIPENLSSVGKKGKINLAWDASAGYGLTSYYVYRGTDPDNLCKIATVYAPATTYEDTDVDDGALYYYHVTSCGLAESEPSNKVSGMHGTRLTNTTAPFATATADSPYVIEGTVSIADQLTLSPNTKLFVLSGAQVIFTKPTTVRLYVDKGLFVTKGTPDQPVCFSSNAGGFELRMVLAAEGSRFDYTEFKDLNGTDTFVSLIISNCSPTFSHCRFVSYPNTNTIANLVNSGANIVSSFFDNTRLNIQQAVLPSLNIESNIFVNAINVMMFANFTSADSNDHLQTGMLHNNVFECNGTSNLNSSTADLAILGNTATAIVFPLTGNYFFRNDNYNTALTTPSDFLVYRSSGCPNHSFNFSGLLNTRPSGVGPGWGTLPF